MKKFFILLLTAATAAALTACSSKTTNLSAEVDDRANTQQIQVEPEKAPDANYPVTFPRIKRPVPGVIRKAFDISGEYTTEYVHIFDHDDAKEKPFYTLELNDDNTFSLHAEVNGVNSDHYGNWYIKHGGSIILFYDEPIDTPAHNVFVSDSMYMEMLPHGKIMFYDNCATIVLSKTEEIA
ncbi:MAG: hypothetical protein J1G04_04055 [Clostridiales bacterium]|nr:hypothetical protein [Clostridiales bacterium]